MTHYETSGAWKSGRIRRYCGPGAWKGGLDPDDYEGDHLYAEYQAVCARWDLAENSFVEIGLGHTIRNATFTEEQELNAVGFLEGDPGIFKTRPIHIAGYTSGRVYVAYSLDNGLGEEDSVSSRLAALSGLVHEVQKTGAFVAPDEIILWAGQLVARDDDDTLKTL